MLYIIYMRRLLNRKYCSDLSNTGTRIFSEEGGSKGFFVHIFFHDIYVAAVPLYIIILYPVDEKRIACVDRWYAAALSREKKLEGGYKSGKCYP